MRYFRTTIAILFMLAFHEAQNAPIEAARLCIFSDLTDENGYTDKIAITSSFLRAVIFEDTPIIVTPPLIHSVKIRAERFQKALENVRAGKPVVLDEKTKEAWRSYSKNIESDYEKAVSGINTMDAHGKNALTKGDAACSFYEKLIQQNSPIIPEFIKTQALADAFAYMSDPSFSRFELFSKAPEYIIAIPKIYFEERRNWLKARITAEGITIPEALMDSCAIGINLTSAEKISQLSSQLASTWQEYTTKTIRDLFTFMAGNTRIDISQFLRMDIFIDGHGSPAATLPTVGFIAGLPNFVVHELIELLATRRFVRSLILQSCYSGGENSKRIREQLKNIPGGDSFLLIVSAIADTATVGAAAFPTVFASGSSCFFAKNSSLAIPLNMAPFELFFDTLNDWYSPKPVSNNLFTDELSKLLTVLVRSRMRKEQGLSLPKTTITQFESTPEPLDGLLKAITQNSDREVLRFDLPQSTHAELIAGPQGLWQKIVNSQESLTSVFESLEKKLELFAPAEEHTPLISTYSLTKVMRILNGKPAANAYAFRFPYTDTWFTDQAVSEIFTISDATVRRALMGGGNALTRRYRYTIQYNPKTALVSVERRSELSPRSQPYEQDIITIPEKTSLILFQTDAIPALLRFNQDPLPALYTAQSFPLIVIDTIEIAAHQFAPLCFAFSAATDLLLSSNRTFVIKKVSAGTNQYKNVVVRIFGENIEKSKIEILYGSTDDKKIFSSGVIQGRSALTKIVFSEAPSRKLYQEILNRAATIDSTSLFLPGALPPKELADTLSAQYKSKRMSNELTLLGTSLLALEDNIRRES